MHQQPTAVFAVGASLQYTHLLLDRHGRDAAWDFFADDSGGKAIDVTLLCELHCVATALLLWM